MILFDKKIAINVSKHARERVRQRRIEHGKYVYKEATDKEIRQFILRLLNTRMVKKQKIETNEKGEKIRKIWTKGSQLLVCKETEKGIVVLTYVACMPEDLTRIMDIPYTKGEFWDSEKFW